LKLLARERDLCWLCLCKVPRCLLELALKFLVHRMAAEDDCVCLIDDDGMRDAANLQTVLERVGLAGLVQSDDVLHLLVHLGHEGPDGGLGLVRDAHDDDVLFLALILRLDLRQVGNRVAARGAPRSPKLEHEHSLCGLTDPAHCIALDDFEPALAPTVTVREDRRQKQSLLLQLWQL